MSRELTSLSLADLRVALGAGSVSAEEVTRAHLDRIAALDDSVRAFVTVTADAALAAARAADAAIARHEDGPLAGVPIAIKDLMAVEGVPCTNGSVAWQDAAPARRDATVVARLRRAGAVVLGTTHLHEIALGSTGVNPGMGTPANPWGVGRVPGGSSSGSAAAVCAGLAVAALGTDTGGSVRVPASLCGITGLKPTYGRVSRAGVTPLSWSLDHVGPMARSAEDIALLLQVIAGADEDDPTAAVIDVPDYRRRLAPTARALRIGVPRRFALAMTEPVVAAAFAAALAEFRHDGATVSDVEVPALDDASAALGAIILAEAYATFGAGLHERTEQLGPETRSMLALGQAVSAQHYLAAVRFRTRLYEQCRDALAAFDVLALPATPIVAPRVEDFVVTVGGTTVTATALLTRLTGPINLSGLPALALPCGFTPEGLPIGLQLVGQPFDEPTVLAAGHAYQQRTDWHRRRPPSDGRETT